MFKYSSLSIVLTLTFQLLLLLSCSNQLSDSDDKKLVQFDGVWSDSIFLKGRTLVAFQFHEKNVKSLDVEFSIPNDEGLLFNVSNQIDFNVGIRGFVFVKNKDTMYLEAGNGFDNSLYRIKEFKKGYFQYTPKIIPTSNRHTLGESFIKSKRIKNIPIIYEDYRTNLSGTTLGKTNFEIVEVSERELDEVHYFRLEGIKESIENLK